MCILKILQVPEEWATNRGVFVGLAPLEACCLSFFRGKFFSTLQLSYLQGPHPTLVRVSNGKHNCVTGKRFSKHLDHTIPDYLSSFSIYFTVLTQPSFSSCFQLYWRKERLFLS